MAASGDTATVVYIPLRLFNPTIREGGLKTWVARSKRNIMQLLRTLRESPIGSELEHPAKFYPFETPTLINAASHRRRVPVRVPYRY